MLKRCPRCQEHKPATLEFFYKGTKWRDGLKPYCRVCNIKQSRAHALANPEMTAARQKKWNKANRAYHADWSKKRQADPLRGMHRRLSNQVRKALAGQKKGRRWEEILGYTVEDLARHLERQFVIGMSWDNRNAWDIDHIVPLASFKDDPMAAWAITNLRPLWKSLNNEKRAMRMHLL